MNAFSALWQKVVRALEWFTIALFAILVLDVIWGVVSRYVPGIRPSDWTEELAVYLLVWVSLLGGALTYRGYGHLGVDYFVGKLDPSAQRVVAVVVEIAALIFAGFALFYGGSRLVAETLATNQLTPVLQWRIGYLYSAVPISGFFICAFAIEHLIKPNPIAATSSPKEG
ncbi:transporter [Nibricoccus aquaticus]|uniref:Transporter n=1 Tax=Nibricoccus aquaticus TaxID=2576891 RepID=A0A290QEI7_9BACT|nr:TRAP transporter small permease [Nibricoccus aquaticus]ATC64676.1 transporter [Nibricoccus aquaticus]